MKHRKLIYSSLCLWALMATSCEFGDQYYIDFCNLKDADPSWFKAVSQHTTDLAGGMPSNCYLPDGIVAKDYDESADTVGDAFNRSENSLTRTSSTSVTNFTQQMLDFGNRNKVIEISGVYQSTDQDGNPITLSGKVMVPATGDIKRYILVSHYTIGSDKEAPSNAFSIEGVLCPLGYALVIPDYIGYGVTKNKIHPYLTMDVTARNVVDMFLAVRPFMHAAGREPKNSDIYLLGYSQGGATSMAVLNLIETEYEDSIKVRRAFVGGGPYDVVATYDQFITTGHAGYPCAVPLVVQGMNVGNHLNIDLSTIMKPFLYQNLDTWINSKQLTTAEMNTLIGTKNTADLLTEFGMNRTSAPVAELYKAMQKNSVLVLSWTPKAPIYMMHSMDDDTVPFVNAQRAKSTWSDANIQYNFGHYGTHVKTCLRFIYTVKSILEEA